MATIFRIGDGGHSAVASFDDAQAALDWMQAIRRPGFYFVDDGYHSDTWAVSGRFGGEWLDGDWSALTPAAIVAAHPHFSA